MEKKYTFYSQFLRVFNRKWQLILLLLTSFQAYGPNHAVGAITNNVRKLTLLDSAKVVGFNLVNAKTDQILQTLADGAVLNLATLPTRQLNVQAVTNPAVIGSVVFHLAGAVVRNHIETGAPYALFGGKGKNYAAWTPVVGKYTLIATPYTGPNGSGLAGVSAIIHFTVINQVQYLLHVATIDSGTVAKYPNQVLFLRGDTVTLTATPAPGYQFNGWSGHAMGRTNPLTLIMNGNKNITANFSLLPLPGALITNLQVQTPRIYALSELVQGTTLYTDRTYQATAVPAWLEGAPFIKTPNDDKRDRSAAALSFDLNHETTVYVAYDPFARVLPGWLSDWQKLPAAIGLNDPRISQLDLYSKVFPAGTVTLGGNLADPAVGSKNTYVVIIKPPEALRPSVTAVRPANGATQVPLDQSVSVDLKYPSGRSINGNTVNPVTVKLFTVGADEQKTPVAGAAVNASAAGDAITLSAPLEPKTTYEFLITDQVKDGFGNRLLPFVSRFTTANSVGDTPTDLSGISFTEQTLVDNTFGSDGFTSLVIGPDHRFYAATSGGKIERWDLNPDGTIGNRITIAPFDSNRRLLIGFRFDPAATATNLVAWISHSSAEFNEVPDWSGKISRVNLTDPTQPEIVDYVVNLPRSSKDHATNSIDFGPDGALYFPQGSNTAMGAPDIAWGLRPERLLTAAVLRLDVGLAQQQFLPLDAKTDEGGTYNPFAANAPLTIYATGLRNAFDLVWHSNGELYVPTNGSAAGGNTLELRAGSIWSNGQVYPGPDIPAITDVRDTQSDYLFRIVKGGYYGHPNPLRHEYILNGGNPTDTLDAGEVIWTAGGLTHGYPVGTLPEPNYQGWAYDFGTNKSPNGVIEYRSNAFGGKLTGKLLVCRFSGGDDVMVLQPGVVNRDIIQATEGIKIPGLRRPFANPLDITEDVQTGNLYISEYHDGNGDGKPRITLLKADQPALGAVAAKGGGLSFPKSRNLQLALYPNPNSGDAVAVALRNFAQREPVTLTLYDLTGRVMQEKTVVTDQRGACRTELLAAQRLARGVYIMQATAATGKKQVRVVVK